VNALDAHNNTLKDEYSIPCLVELKNNEEINQHYFELMRKTDS